MNIELKWTGERYLPGVGDDIELEHLHRYMFASEFVKGKSVLDIACGEGYGSFFLSKKASQVTGVDISDNAVCYASKKYVSSNLKFLHGDCKDIPLKDNSVDVVVSFETIEHHDAHEEMLKEIDRVLREDGVLIISSPDKKEYSDVRQYNNKYHVKELYFDEFNNLLKDYFPYVNIMVQRLKYGSFIHQLEKNKDPKKNIHFNLSAPLYFIAVASRINVVAGFDSFYEGKLEKSDVLLAEKQNAAEQIEYRDSLVEELYGQIAVRDEMLSSRKNLLKLLFKLK